MFKPFALIPRFMRPLQALLSWVFVLVLAAAWVAPVQARTILELDTHKQPVDLGDWGDQFLDTTGAMSLEAVVAQNAFMPMKLGAPSPTQRGNKHWIRFTIPPAPDAERWYLEIPWSPLNKATLYTQDAAGQWIATRAGDLVPVAEWPVPARHVLLPVAVSAEVQMRFMLSLEHDKAISAPLRFVSESGSNDKQQRVSLVLGGFFGFCLLVLAYSLLSAYALRDENYALFALYVGLIVVAQLGSTGVGAFALWPKSPEWADVASVVGILVALPVLYRLAARVSGLSARERLWGPVLWAGAGICLSAATGLLVFGSQSAYRDNVAAPLIALALIPVAVISLRAVALGDRVAPWVLVANAPVAIAALWQILANFDWVSQGSFGPILVQLGLVWQLPVLLVALAMRGQERRTVRQRISDLNRVDGSTGLVLSQVLIYRANVATIRARRNHGQAALLRVDVENTDSLRREFGRKPSADMQLRFAERLLRVVRDIDTVAALDDGQYAVFIEGPVQEHEVRDLATKILARSLQPFANLNSALVPKVHITGLMLPWADEDAVRALAAMDAAYRKRDPADRRAIQMLTAEEASLADVLPVQNPAAEPRAGG